MKYVQLAVLIVFALVASSRAQHQGVMYHFPRWSPDARWILASSTAGGDPEIVLIPVVGGAIKQLTDNEVPDDLARWIDGGRRILFVSERRGKPEPFVMGADGSNPQLAAESEEDAFVPASPDGRFELRESNGTILLVDRASKATRPVTAGPWAEQPSFSPDGRFIVYEQRATADPHRVETSSIVVALADGSEPKAIVSGTDPSWSPDGARLLFKMREPATGGLVVTTARPDGSDVRRLAPGARRSPPVVTRRPADCLHERFGGRRAYLGDEGRRNRPAMPDLLQVRWRGLAGCLAFDAQRVDRR